MGDSHNSWGATYVDKLLPGRKWTLGFIVGGSWGGGISRDVPTSSLRFLGGSQLAHAVIRSQNLKQQLGRYAVKSLPKTNWEVNIFACSLCA